MTTTYQVEAAGGCLGDWIPDGTKLLADPAVPLRPLDLCSIQIKDGEGHWPRFIRSCGEGFHGVCKIYLGTFQHQDGEMLVVGQLFPPVTSLIPMTEVESIARVMGCIGMAAKMGEEDAKALRIIASFAPVGA
jgi:hypothetical protein